MWLFALLAVIELVGHGVAQQRAITTSDWDRASDLVRASWESGDTVVVAPTWLDPQVRLHLGDLIGIRHAGASDLAPFDRLWVISGRGHDSPWSPPREPDLHRPAGRLLVERWDLGSSSLLFDLTSSIEHAEVFRGNRLCRWRRSAPSGGGLGSGPLFPGEHHFCGPEQWLLTGETVNEDLHLQPRHCVWQHPAPGGEPIRATFRDIPLGERLVLYAGIYYEHERMREHGPATLRVLRGDDEIGRLVHEDGDGWERIESQTGGGRGDITIEVTADNPHLRSMCWAATTRGPAREFGE